MAKRRAEHRPRWGHIFIRRECSEVRPLCGYAETSVRVGANINRDGFDRGLRALLRRASRGSFAPMIARLRRVLARQVLSLRPHVKSAIGVPLVVDPTDPRAVELFVGRGAIDHDVVQLWRLLVLAVMPDVVVDVGANYGEILFGTNYPPGTTIMALEPNPRVASALASTISTGPHRVELHRVAAGDRPGVATLDVPWESSGLGAINRSSLASRRYVVECKTLDELISAQRGTRLLLKVDVEGSEGSVLRGATDALSRSSLAVIVSEVSPTNVEDLKELGTLLSARVLYFERRSLSVVHTDRPPLATIASDIREHPYLRDVVILIGDENLQQQVRLELESLISRYGPRPLRGFTPSPLQD